MSVRALADGDLDAAVSLHLQVLHMEFLSRFGPRFMRAYYHAWIASPGSLGLAAVDEDGSLLGVLLGANDPALHVRAMVRAHGVGLGAALVGYSLTHPRLAKDLIVTRGWRYTRGIARLVVARLSKRPPANPVAQGPVVGEITHVLVDPASQGRGVGRALVEESVRQARDAGVQELQLVTPPDMAAQHFYERLGWHASGEMSSRSGERFLRYRLTV
ncbi:MAG: GNAT family N-acetyltransferase [Acidimicrobiales bacterium]